MVPGMHPLLLFLIMCKLCLILLPVWEPFHGTLYHESILTLALIPDLREHPVLPRTNISISTIRPAIGPNMNPIPTASSLPPPPISLPQNPNTLASAHPNAVITAEPQLASVALYPSNMRTQTSVVESKCLYIHK